LRNQLAVAGKQPNQWSGQRGEFVAVVAKTSNHSSGQSSDWSGQSSAASATHADPLWIREVAIAGGF